MSISYAQLDPLQQAVARDRAEQVLKTIQEGRAAATEDLQRLLEELERRAKDVSLGDDLPPVFQCLLQPARYKGAYGGRGSAKSWTFARMVLSRCRRIPGTRVVCIREVQKSLEQSVKRLLEDLIKLYDLGRDFTILNTHIETPGGGIIIFQGMQNHTAESIKSFEGFDIAWVEEAQSLSERSLTLLRPTIRKPQSELWFTWNPRHATDPIDSFLRGKDIPQGALVVEATFRDNPFFPKVLQVEMEWDRRRDQEKFEHVWLGGYEARSESRVFKNWHIDDFPTPANAEFLLGGDWGFANDPTTLVREFIVGRKLFVDWEAFQIGCEIDDTAALFDTIGCTECRNSGSILDRCDGSGRGHASARDWVLRADSARPETISYLQRHGYSRIIPARKGPGSVEEGVKFLKSYDIIIHPRCTHAQDEMRSYSYKTHALTGDILPLLEDKKNHIIDPMRYGVESVGKEAARFGDVRDTPPPAFQIPRPTLVSTRSGGSSSFGNPSTPAFDIGSINRLFGR